MSGVSSLLMQLLSINADAAEMKAAEQPAWPVNPFPRGIRSGSATDRVLADLVRAVPRYLESHGLAEGLSDPRNAHYLRWRAT